MRTGEQVISEYDIFEFLTIVDDVAVSASSNWDPASFSKQWPEIFEGGRVLSWKNSRRIGSCEKDSQYTIVISWEPISYLFFDFMYVMML